MIRLRPSGSGGHVLLAILVALGCAIGPLGAQGRGGAPVYGYEVVKVYPHDREAFTQGLLYRDGVLYESTGLNSRSSLRKVQLETGKVLQQVPVESRYFAEGLTDWGGRLVQLTWNTNIGFVYDLASFKQLQTFSYTGEGWGLARDDRRIIMSDGTSTLRFLDPQTLKTTEKDKGVRIRPEHIHLALREFAGIAEHPLSKKFPLGVTEKESLKGFWG